MAESGALASSSSSASGGAGASPGGGVLDRLSEWERRRQERQADAQYEALVQEMAPLTFAPQISAAASAAESRLPEDVKAALRSPEGAPGARPAALALAAGSEEALAEAQRRRENQLRAFLFRQARARADREARLEAGNFRGVVPAPRPRAAPPAGTVTVPHAPRLETAARASAAAASPSHAHAQAHAAAGSPARGGAAYWRLLHSASAGGAGAAGGAGGAGSPALVPLSALAGSHLPSPALVVPGSGAFSAAATWAGGAAPGAAPAVPMPFFAASPPPLPAAAPSPSAAGAAAWQRYGPDFAAALLNGGGAGAGAGVGAGAGGGSLRSQLLDIPLRGAAPAPALSAAPAGAAAFAPTTLEPAALLSQLSVRDLYDDSIAGALAQRAAER